MCGIIGVINQKEAFNQVKEALALLKNRGKDGFGIITNNHAQHVKDLEDLKDDNSNIVIGHTLHSVVGHMPQPIKLKGTLVANCEIYNWKELNNKYKFSATSDSELLLMFLDNCGLDRLDELDGVYAFAYLRDNKFFLARDILGVKPLMFAYNTDNFAFASEGKVLEKLNYIDIQELNPRKILVYDTKSRKIEIKNKKFFEIVPEHKETNEKIKEKLKQLLDIAIKKRIPKQKVGLLFSGGIDSTFIAKSLKDNNIEFTCYTTVLDTETAIPEDLTYAKKVAKDLNLNLKIKEVKLDAIPSYLERIVPLIEDSNVTKVGVALTFYLACEMAKVDGCKVIFSGLGSEEIFAGYERHKQSVSINKECKSGLIKMYERDLYRDDVLCMDNNLELRLPFLDEDLVDFALKIPERLKIKEGFGKHILREIMFDEGIKKEFAFRKKKAAQYGSRIDNALGRLTRRAGYKFKSDYLRDFYPKHNLKLGVLFSSGKDSSSAAYIMLKQNYQITCLITMKSSNPDSYMFQSAGTELVELQAKAMKIPIIIQETEGVKEKELNDLEKAIKKAKQEYQIDGIITGALFSNYQRDRIEKICDNLGLKIFSPLWHKPQEKHMQEVINNKFEVILTRISADGLDESWLGRSINQELLNDILYLNEKIGINVAFEGGEAETVVLDGPIELFKQKIEIVKAEKIMVDKFTGVYRIVKAKLVDKK